MTSIYFDLDIPKVLATKLLARALPFVHFTPLSPVRRGQIPDQALPGPNWVRVKSILAGICGADIAMFFVQASPSISLAALPGVRRAFLGHEVLGRVVETGTGVTGLSAGDRVVLQAYLPCCSIQEIDPPCGPCKEGNYTLCENFSEGRLPGNLGAGFSDAFLAHRSQLIKVPDEIPDHIAVLIEPAAVSLHAVLRRPPLDREKVLVIGAGTIGLNVIQFAKAVEPGCIVHVLEKAEFKQELACRLGADHVIRGDPYEGVARATGAKLFRGALRNSNLLGGFDLAYDCVGHSDTLQHCLRWLRSRGDYVMIGNQLSPVTFDHTPVWHQEIRILGINAHGRETFRGRELSSFDLAIEFIREGKIRLDGFITHRFAFDQVQEAFKLARSKAGRVIKIVFEFDRPGH